MSQKKTKTSIVTNWLCSKILIGCPRIIFGYNSGLLKITWKTIYDQDAESKLSLQKTSIFRKSLCSDQDLGCNHYNFPPLINLVGKSKEQKSLPIDIAFPIQMNQQYIIF